MSASSGRLVTQEKALQLAGVSFATGIVVGWLAHRSFRRVRQPQLHLSALIVLGCCHCFLAHAEL